MPRKVAKKSSVRRRPRVSSVKKIVRRELQRSGEKKFLLTDQTPTVASWLGQVVLLTGLTQGDTALTREGRKINLCSLSMKYSWDILNASDAVGSQLPTVARPKFVRCIIFQDKLGDGTVPTATNVLQTMGTASAHLQHLEYSQIDRWRILHDKVFSINPGGLIDTGHNVGIPFDYQNVDTNNRYASVYKKFKNLPVTYQGDTAAQADVLKNAIYVLFLSDQSDAATATDDARARLAFNCRIRFCE